MRYSSIDILRTVALFVMVFVHFGENLSGYIAPFAGFGAPLFAFLSGVSYFLWSHVQEARGKSAQEISKISVRRGLFVFGAGFAFNILIWLPEDTFNWDVLTFIGAALILLNLARKVPLSISMLVAILSVALSPILRDMADYNAYWQNNYFDPDLTLPDVTIGFLATGYFPIFPWIAFSLTGFVTASLLFAMSDEPQESAPSSWPTMLFGAMLLALAFGWLAIRTYLLAPQFQIVSHGWSMFPPTTAYVLGTLGMTLLLLGLTHRWVDCNPQVLRHRGPLDIAKTFSRYSFTIYVLHHVVHLWPMWIYAVAVGQEPTYYWQQAMPITVSMPLALLFMACCYLLLRRLGPERSYGIEAAMRWLCD